MPKRKSLKHAHAKSQACNNWPDVTPPADTTVLYHNPNAIQGYGQVILSLPGGVSGRLWMLG